jgi:predicted nuclease of predicted toxin-antitoxin system
VKFRFFIDQCVPREIVLTLQEHGHEVLLLRDFLPIRSPDPVVIAKAQELRCVLLSLDGDFADIVSYPPGRYGGILAIQLHNHPEIIPELMKSLAGFLEVQSDSDLFRGKLFIAEAHRIRIRPS